MIANSTDFILPPTDGSVPLNRLVDFHLKHNPQHPWVVLSAKGDTPESIVTYEQLAHGVHRAAHIINPDTSIAQGTKVGILATADTIVYMTLILGTMQAGLIPFPLSPRTQVAGIAHLLGTTSTSHAIVGGSPAVLNLCDDIVSSLSNDDFRLSTIPLPGLSDLYPDLGSSKSGNPEAFRLFREAEPSRDNDTVVVIHSSGSTGLPRPVNYHQKGVICNIINQPSTQDYGNPGSRVALMALPSFHAMGYVLQCLRPLFTGYVPVLFAPSSPPVIPTADLVMQAIVHSKCTRVYSVPAFLETWVKDEEAIKQLKKLRGVMCGGGSLAQWIGDRLVSQGVPLDSRYGSTEVGSPTYRDTDRCSPSDWVYFMFSKNVDARFVEQNDPEGTCEVVFVESESHKPFLYNDELDGKRAYRTKDLVVRHPTKEGFWTVVGRLDDQIVLLNGEKTNPGSMETEIQKSPIVQFAVMFGRERNQTGVLIELVPSVQDKSLDPVGRAELVEDIWPHVEKANATSPSHSRLEKSAIVFTHPDRPLPRTPKATVPRAAAIKAYAEEIEGMYASLERNTDTSAVAVAGPKTWHEQGAVQEWLQEIVEHLLGRSVDVREDLFQQGFDSLTATLLYRAIKAALCAAADPGVKSVGDKITQQTVFTKPTIQQLVQFILQTSSNPHSATGDDLHKAKLETIRSLIERHTPSRSPMMPQVHQPHAERVVLTGTTGSLGTHLLAQLLQSDKVERVWALNRKSKDGIATMDKRQRSSFENKCLDVGLLGSEKLVLLESDLTVDGLGLDKDMLKEIQRSATAIIHNAWQVNFNLSLQSFEPSIVGAENLINLAFRSAHRPRFLFASSISAAGVNEPGRTIEEEYVRFEDVTTGLGYGESKLVTEKMIESAQASGLETCVIRLGQLTGDKISGAWPPTDWVPSFVASSRSVGCLPNAAGSVSWIPLDVAATAVIDACTHRTALLPPVISCAHPRPVPWSQVMSSFSRLLASRKDKPLPIIPFAEWNKMVANSASSIETADEAFKRFPSTKIQKTFDGMVHGNETMRLQGTVADEQVEACGMARMSLKKAEELSEALRNAEPLEEGHVEKWVSYWEKCGLFF